MGKVRKEKGQGREKERRRAGAFAILSVPAKASLLNLFQLSFPFDLSFKTFVSVHILQEESFLCNGYQMNIRSICSAPFQCSISKLENLI